MARSICMLYQDLLNLFSLDYFKQFTYPNMLWELEFGNW